MTHPFRVHRLVVFSGPLLSVAVGFADLGQSDTVLLDPEVDTKSTYEFLNFDPAPANAGGLDAIFAGRAFKPSGVPYKIKHRLNRLADSLGNVGIQIMPAYDGRFVPSPPSRQKGFAPGGMDPGLIRSVFMIGRCPVRSKPDSHLSVVLPQDEFSGHADCSGVPEAERKLVLEHNCFTCHAGVTGKYIVAGAHSNYGHQHLLFTELSDLRLNFDAAAADSFPTRLRQKVAQVLFGLGDYEEELFTRYFDFANRAILPTFKHAMTVGDNIGLYTSYGGIEALDPARPIFYVRSRSDVQSTSRSVLGTEPHLPTVDANPWWNLKFKRHVFWKGEFSSQNPRQNLVRFLHGFNFQHEGMEYDYEAAVQRLALVFDYALSLDSPSYPYPIDSTAVQRGHHLFHSARVEHEGQKVSCADCHGAYSKISHGDDQENGWRWKVVYPGPKTKIQDVNSDGLYSAVTHRITQKLQPIIEEATSAERARSGFEFAESYAPRVDVGTERGVMPPPLVGTWASAPYFHNGSIPTLYHVLKADLRPETWTRPMAGADGFDRQKVGFSFTTEQGSDRHTYDTSRPGRSNKGHDFANHWNDQEIFDVIEFLKALSGPGVRPAATGQGLDRLRLPQDEPKRIFR